MTRGQRYIDAGAPLPLVEVEAGEYLLDTIKELGPIRSNGMGLEIPSWTELRSFAEANGLPLLSWEYRLMRKMCNAYLAGFKSGSEPLSMPPIERGQENEDHHD